LAYVALATAQFAQTRSYYAEVLGLTVLREWDRPNARGCMLDFFGMRLEILDSLREVQSLQLSSPADDRVHLVAEVEELDRIYQRLRLAELPWPMTPPTETNWGVRLLQTRDPDGVRIAFLQPQSP
jgi:catechol 2,3-dioxygenase-like lactoylglutathione lyase family enzyme